MLAGEFLELGTEHRELLLHDVCPDLGYILPDQPELILKFQVTQAHKGNQGSEKKISS